MEEPAIAMMPSRWRCDIRRLLQQLAGSQCQASMDWEGGVDCFFGFCVVGFVDIALF